MSEPVPSVEDRALALSKLHSAAAQLGLPYEVLEGIALEPGLAGLSTNKARRFNVYQAVAMALGVVSGGLGTLLERCAAARSPQIHILVMQRGKGNRADLGSDLEEALRLLYPNPGGSAFKDSLASLRRACPARLPGCGTLSSGTCAALPTASVLPLDAWPQPCVSGARAPSRISGRRHSTAPSGRCRAPACQAECCKTCSSSSRGGGGAGQCH